MAFQVLLKGVLASAPLVSPPNSQALAPQRTWHHLGWSVTCTLMSCLHSPAVGLWRAEVGPDPPCASWRWLSDSVELLSSRGAGLLVTKVSRFVSVSGVLL